MHRPWLSAAFLTCAMCGSISAQGGSRVVAPEILRYLQLTAEQAANLNQLVADWNTALQDKTREADQIRTGIQAETAKDQPEAATLGAAYVRLEGVCRAATAGRADLLQKTRAILTRDQFLRLQTLEDAFSLMPRVAEAQRLGLLPDVLETSPVGFPAGQISVPLSFVASTPALLPGCLPSTQVQPGTVPVLTRGRR